MEDWVSIKNLRTKNPDLGTRKIAELLGVSRNTVKKALASEDAPKYREVQHLQSMSMYCPLRVLLKSHF